jgi:hypothetical protein
LQELAQGMDEVDYSELNHNNRLEKKYAKVVASKVQKYLLAHANTCTHMSDLLDNVDALESPSGALEAGESIIPFLEKEYLAYGDLLSTTKSLIQLGRMAVPSPMADIEKAFDEKK